MMIGHLLLDAIGAQALDPPLNIDLRLVDRITQALAGIAAHDQATGLGHEGAEVADRPTDHDIHPLHGDAATRRSVALDDQEAAVARGTCGLAGIAFDPDRTRHDVLGDADAAMAVDDHLRLLVHAGAVVADMALDLDLERQIEPRCHSMSTLGVDDP